MDWMFAAPLFVLRHFFGVEWVKTHLYDGGFLKPPSREIDSVKQQQVGLIGYRIAETLFNLQNIEGFANIHARMLGGATNAIESCFGELEAARFLGLRGESFRFVTPRGTRGNDYDIEVSRDAGPLCCEAKVKLEAVELTETGVYNSLEKARKRNLPTSRPGVIFLRIVGVTSNAELQAHARIVNAGVERLFRQTTRVVGVVLLTSLYRLANDEQIEWSLWRTMPNARSQHPTSLLNKFCHEHVEVRRENWTYLVQYKPRFVFDWA